MPRTKCLLWDFGDTLCDERFIWSSGPEWMEIYKTFDDDGLGASWNLGKINAWQFAAAVSERLDRSAKSVLAHMTQCCSHVEFFESTFAFFKARHLHQAIVTVNPDLFSDVIVPIWQLDAHCDVIVTSWEEGTIDKNVLCRLAIERMGLTCENHEALLIDNKRSNIDGWASVGGAGYHYVGDTEFSSDVASGIDSL